jgi:hypothetical protein
MLKSWNILSVHLVEQTGYIYRWNELAFKLYDLRDHTDWTSFWTSNELHYKLGLHMK